MEKENNVFTAKFTIGDKVQVYSEDCVQMMEKGEDHSGHGFTGVIVKVSFTCSKVWYSILTDDDAEVISIPSELVYEQKEKING